MQDFLDPVGDGTGDGHYGVDTLRVTLGIRPEAADGGKVPVIRVRRTEDPSSSTKPTSRNARGVLSLPG